MPPALLCHQRGEAGLLIRAGKVELFAQQGAAQKNEPRHQNGAGDALHKIEGGLVQPAPQQPEQPPWRRALRQAMTTSTAMSRRISISSKFILSKHLRYRL